MLRHLYGRSRQCITLDHEAKQRAMQETAWADVSNVVNLLRDTADLSEGTSRNRRSVRRQLTRRAVLRR